MAILKNLLLPALRHPVLAPVVHKWVRSRTGRRHPFDIANGVDTSGFVPAEFLFAPQETRQAHAYGGCVPSCVETALNAIPALERAVFIDIGCGLGRALFVARGFPFVALTGIELSPVLADGARANARRFARKSSGADINIVTGDATAPVLPDEHDVVVFFYNSFGRDLVARLADHVMAQCGPTRRVFIVSANPVHADIFDAMAGFGRWFAAVVPYAPEELGFGPDEEEAVIVWANAAAGESPHPGRNAAIRVIQAGWRVGLTS